MDLDTAPTDGKIICLLGPEGQSAEGHWRNTRKIIDGRWQATGHWVIIEGQQFNPVGWRPSRWVER